MEKKSTYQRSSVEEIGILNIQPSGAQLPDGTYAVNKYFFMVELPAVDNILMNEPVYNVDPTTGEGVLKYTFSYNGNGPGSDESVKSKLLDPYLNQDIEGIKFVVVEGPPVDPNIGVNTLFKSTGTVANQQSHPLDLTGEPVGKIRSLVVTSMFDPTKFWVIGLVKQDNTLLPLYMMKDPINANWIRAMSIPTTGLPTPVAVCGCIPSIDGEYTQAHMMGSTDLYPIPEYSSASIL